MDLRFLIRTVPHKDLNYFRDALGFRLEEAEKEIVVFPLTQLFKLRSHFGRTKEHPQFDLINSELERRQFILNHLSVVISLIAMAVSIIAIGYNICA